MSELSFLIDLLLNHRLTKEVKNKVAERIKEIEAQPHQVAPRPIVMQAPSTIANMGGHEVLPPPPPQARIVGGLVDTGGGTKGPRKW